jgi:hypothetical protein
LPTDALELDWHDHSCELAWYEHPETPLANPGVIQLAEYASEPWPAVGTNSEAMVGDYYLPHDDCPQLDPVLPHGLYAFYGYDSWRGIQDDGWGNNGLHLGANYGTRLGPVSDWTGIGFQIGGMAGVYNWSGTDYHLTDQDQPTIQGFLTYGFFRTANDTSNWSGALVHDWMFTDNFGIFAQDPVLAQWRGQVGYAVGPWNELGLWGTLRGIDDTRNVPFFGPTTWRPVEQVNLYWRHKWGPGGPDTWVWFGVPEDERLEGGGSLGDYLAGAAANAPLADRVMLYTLVTYMHPSAGLGAPGATEEAWNFAIGLAFYPAANTRTATVADRTWLPQMPVANNGYFLVDTSQTY